MDRRARQVYEEASALWRELYCEAPPERLDPATMLDMIMQGLPETSYDRIRSPYLRPSMITGPKTRRDS
jgi:hypothetical protein